MHPKVCDEELASQRPARRCSRPPHFPRHTIGCPARGGGLTLRLLAGRSLGGRKGGRPQNYKSKARVAVGYAGSCLTRRL